MSRESETLFDAITQIDDDLLPSERRPKRRMPSWRAFVAAAAILAILISPFVVRIGSRDTAEETADGAEPFALAQPVYPVMAAYPKDGGGDYEAWWADVKKQTDQPEGYADSLRAFFRESMREYLTGAGAENRAVSPVNIYMALAMLAETTGGESRAQILNLLGADSIDALRAQAGSVWNANYRDDGISKCVLANSLWLRDGAEYHQQTADALAQHYYTSVFRGEMGTDAYNRMLRDWLNEQTGGLLEEQTAQEGFDADTALGLASAIDFRKAWTDPFSAELTKPGVFHAVGGDQTAEFMHKYEAMTGYFRGARFGAISLPLETDGAMWLILPDEGVPPEELLQDDDALRFMTDSKRDWADSKTALINLALPKFDACSRVSLLDGLKALGVRDVLDPEAADFSPVLADSEGLWLSDANHAVRVAIDEEGVVAAAYTAMAVGEGAPDADLLVDFTLDRPFLCVISGHADVPLFAGIIHQVGSAAP